MTIARSPAVRRTTPEVQAVACSVGHLNPPQADVCRNCGQPLAGEAHWVTRPSLGRLLLPDHEIFEVDRGVVFGRQPVQPPDADERPHLINVSTYGLHLSRMHFELVLDGWFVLARDLGSRSGTFLTLPGHAEEQLRAHELVVLQPGSVVNLAGDYEFRYEVRL